MSKLLTKDPSCEALLPGLLTIDERIKNQQDKVRKTRKPRYLRDADFDRSNGAVYAMANPMTNAINSL